MVKVQKTKTVPSARMADGKIVAVTKPIVSTRPLSDMGGLKARYSQGYWAGKYLTDQIKKSAGSNKKYLR